jgi:hypothetical protein
MSTAIAVENHLHRSGLGYAGCHQRGYNHYALLLSFLGRNFVGYIGWDLYCTSVYIGVFHRYHHSCAYLLYDSSGYNR